MFTKWSSWPLEIGSSNFEIRNKFKILISKSRKCTAWKLAYVEFSILNILHCFEFRASDFELCFGGITSLATTRNSAGTGTVIAWLRLCRNLLERRYVIDECRSRIRLRSCRPGYESLSGDALRSR